MKNLMIIGCLLLVGLAPVAFSQSVVTNGLILSNGTSTVTIENPNTKGTYVLQLPVVPTLTPGQHQDFVLRMVGTENGTALAFTEMPDALTAKPDASQQRIAVNSDLVAPPNIVGQAVAVHTFAEVDLGPVPPGGAYILKLNFAAVKAGAAITVSPAEELPTGLFPAFAWAPIDCVVLVKFMNMGDIAVDIPAMQFSVGAINP